MEKDFDLKALTLTDTGADIKYRTETEDGFGTVTEQLQRIEATRPVHSDLWDLFNRDLSGIAAEIVGLPDGDPDFSGISATGVSFAGKGKDIGIVIKGHKHTAYGRVSFKTPRIKYLSGDSRICARLTVTAERLVEEAKAYLFEGKSAEMAVFGE